MREKAALALAMRPSGPRMAMPNGADWKKRAKRAFAASPSISAGSSPARLSTATVRPLPLGTVRASSRTGRMRPSSRTRSTSRLAGLVVARANRPEIEPGVVARRDVGERHMLIEDRLRRAPDPGRERAVDMQERTVAAHGGEPHRHGIELRELHLDAGNPVGLLLTLGGDVGDAPQHELALRAVAVGGKGMHGGTHGAHPARRGGSLVERKLLGERFAALGRPRQAEEGGAGLRLAREQLLQRAEAIGAGAADDLLECRVGVDAFAVRRGDHHAAVEHVGRRRHDLGDGRALSEAQVAGGEGEEKEQADRCQHGHRGQQERQARAARNERKDDRAPRHRGGDRRQHAAEAQHRAEGVEWGRLQLDRVVITHT